MSNREHLSLPCPTTRVIIKFMAFSMEQTMSLLQLKHPIIRLSNPSLHNHLVQCGLITIKNTEGRMVKQKEEKVAQNHDAT